MIGEHIGPDPDRLLESIQRSDSKGNGRGKLKVFIGMAAGVGKTYAMLGQARKLLEKIPVDLVVGIVETHGRKETADLLEGLTLIARQKIAYHNVILEEMDLDAILARRPQIVLVDELAHTNAPSCRHAKRFQDVQELLDVGIDVWTTINVQHLESRADTVRDITGVTVVETVPDSILSQAAEVLLIDLSPEELLNRLKEGKIYAGDKAEIAAENFFKIGNLTALREMALRVTAVQVDQNLVDIRRLQHTTVQWKASDRLMVAIYASPFSERMVRWTKRQADAMGASWFAAYIELETPLSSIEQELLTKNLTLVQELGGEVATIKAVDAVHGLLRLAHDLNISLLVVGRSRRPFIYNLFRRGSLVHRLLRESKDIDIYVVTAEPTRHQRFSLNLENLDRSHLSRDLVLVIFVTALLAGLGTAATPFIEYQAIGLFFLLEVAFLSMFVGWLGSFFAALVSGMVWDFFFIPPRFTFEIRKPGDVIMSVTYFVVAAIIGTLTYRIRREQRSDQKREKRTSGLYQLTRELSSAHSMDEVLSNAIPRIGQTFDADVAIILPDNSKGGRLANHTASMISLDLKEMTVAAWVMEHGRAAGRFTDTLSSAQFMHIPLVADKKVLGVMAISPRFSKNISIDNRGLIDVFGKQLAIGFEREELHDIAKKTILAEESERLSTALINCVSHEMKTPLAAIQGAASAILEPSILKDEKTLSAFTQQISEGVLRLTRLVENLLDMSRIEAGSIKLHKQAIDLKELVGVVLRRLGKELVGRNIIINIGELPMVSIDLHLIEQVIGNIIHNAAVHTPSHCTLDIKGYSDGDDVVLAFSDDGPGLPTDNFELVFNKFYRGDHVHAGSTGLGLAIARGFIEVHGGSLTARNGPQGGAEFLMRLPKDKQDG